MGTLKASYLSHKIRNIWITNIWRALHNKKDSPTLLGLKGLLPCNTGLTNAGLTTCQCQPSIPFWQVMSPSINSDRSCHHPSTLTGHVTIHPLWQVMSPSIHSDKSCHHPSTPTGHVTIYPIWQVCHHPSILPNMSPSILLSGNSHCSLYLAIKLSMATSDNVKFVIPWIYYQNLRPFANKSSSLWKSSQKNNNHL